MSTASNHIRRSTRRLPAAAIAQRAGGQCIGGFAAVVVALVTAWSAFAQEATQVEVIDREYAIKAAFLYHFSTYVEWPPGTFEAAEAPFVIGVYQTDPFGTALQTVAASKKVAGRSIAIRRIDSRQDVQDCQILFVPNSVPWQEQEAVIHSARDAQVLVVGESDDFVEQGGDVQFFVEGNKVRFAFGAEVTRRGELKVSSKLLSLAKIIPSAE